MSPVSDPSATLLLSRVIGKQPQTTVLASPTRQPKNIAQAERRGMDYQRHNQRARQATASETASERATGLSSETVSEALARSIHLLEPHNDVGFRMRSLCAITVCRQPTPNHTQHKCSDKSPPSTVRHRRHEDNPHVHTLFAVRLSFQKRSWKWRCHPPSVAIRHRMTWTHFSDRDALFRKYVAFSRASLSNVFTRRCPCAVPRVAWRGRRLKGRSEQ